MVNNMDDMKKHQLTDIICYERDCKNCRLKEYRKQYNLKFCHEVPFNFQLKYARRLFGCSEKTILNTIAKCSFPKSYMEVLEMITCGVKYE